MRAFRLNMKPKHRLGCIKYTTVVGCCLLLVPNGLFWYWGNLAVYCMSYFVSVLDQSSGVESSWIFSLFIICWTVGITISSTIAKRVGRKFTMLFGAFVFDLGVFFGYLSVQHSLAALTTTMGAVTGLGTGLMDGSALQVVIEWSDNEVGRFTAALQGSLSLGALVINQVVTIYINPDNITPDYVMGPTRFFTQKKVLDNIPSMFLVIGGFSLGLHLIGFSLVRERGTVKGFDCNENDNNPTEQTSLNKPALNNKASYAGNTVNDVSECNINEEGNTTNTNVESDADSEGNNTNIEGNANADDNTNAKSQSGGTNAETNTNDKGNNGNTNTISTENTETGDFNYKQMLRCKSFYVLWVSFFLCGMPFVLIGSYYKMFGQGWIEDDHFFTDLAMTMSVGSAVMSGLWGFAMDAFGVKKCQIAFMTTMVLVLFWYYFTPMVSRWLFFVVSLLFMCVSGPIFGCFTSATAILYGKTNMSTNFGIMMTAQMCFNIISPFIVGRLLNNLGWFITYAGTGAVLLIGLVPTMLFVPNM